MHNRRDSGGSWIDAASSDDHWGRALWALSVAATTLADRSQAARALGAARTALRARSTWPRAMAYAALGAGRLLSGNVGERAALPLLTDARRVLASRADRADLGRGPRRDSRTRMPYSPKP